MKQNIDMDISFLAKILPLHCQSDFVKQVLETSTWKLCKWHHPHNMYHHNKQFCTIACIADAENIYFYVHIYATTTFNHDIKIKIIFLLPTT